MTLQKDITIIRTEINKKAGRFEYTLFREGKKVKSRKSDREYNFGLVEVGRDGNLYMDSMRKNASQFEKRQLEDPNAFIITVTIN